MFQQINIFGLFSIKTTNLLSGAGLAILFCLFVSATTPTAQAQTPPNLIVTKTADTNDGVCGITDCSLREAIDVADSNGVPDVIGFNIPATDPNCAGGACEIDMTFGNFAPDADSGNLITIDGSSGANKITLDAQNLSRHFTIQAGRKMAINNLTLRRGSGTGAVSSTVGGSIFVIGAGSDLRLNNVTFSSNNAVGDGGAVNANNGAVLTMTNSTVNNNTSGNSGGGVAVLGATGTLTNVTISANTAATAGGGLILFGSGGNLTATSLTITGNTANTANPTFTGGGGFFHGGSANIPTVRNSIVSGNTHPTSPDVFGTFSSSGYNFIGKNNGSNFVAGNPNASQDIVGTIASPQDPQLQPLASNGGPTQTHALLITSPAFDKGNSFGTTTDQRGFTRPVDSPLVANAAGGDGSEIGAFELVTEANLALSLVVTPDPVAPGANLTYQITLSNSGSDVTAENIVLTQSDFFRQRGGTRLTVQSITAPGGFTCQIGAGLLDPPLAEIVCRGSLAAGQQAQFTIVKRQRVSLPRGMIIDNKADVSWGTFGNSTRSNQASDTTLVQ